MSKRARSLLASAKSDGNDNKKLSFIEYPIGNPKRHLQFSKEIRGPLEAEALMQPAMRFSKEHGLSKITKHFVVVKGKSDEQFAQTGIRYTYMPYLASLLQSVVFNTIGGERHKYYPLPSFVINAREYDIHMIVLEGQYHVVLLLAQENVLYDPNEHTTVLRDGVERQLRDEAIDVHAADVVGMCKVSPIGEELMDKVRDAYGEHPKSCVYVSRLMHQQAENDVNFRADLRHLVPRAVGANSARSDPRNGQGLCSLYCLYMAHIYSLLRARNTVRIAFEFIKKANTVNYEDLELFFAVPNLLNQFPELRFYFDSAAELQAFFNVYL